MPFGEVEKHCRIAAGGTGPPGGGQGLEAALFEKLLPLHALHAILPIEDHACSTVGIEHRRRGSQLLDEAPGLLAARTIAGTRQNRRADGLELYLAASTCRGYLHLIHSAVSRFIWKTILSAARSVRNGSLFPYCVLSKQNGPPLLQLSSPASANEIRAREGDPGRETAQVSTPGFPSLGVGRASPGMTRSAGGAALKTKGPPVMGR